MGGVGEDPDELTAMSMLPKACLLASCALLTSCAQWFFSGRPEPSRMRPVALVETTGGVEFGATTEFGILTLGRTATTGPCRVHIFLGENPIIEDGTLTSATPTFCRADIVLTTQRIRVLDRPLQDGDELVAMYTPDGSSLVERSVERAAGMGAMGDLVDAGGAELPAGAAILLDSDEGYRFVGLVTARAELTTEGSTRTYHAYAGLDRLRELAAVPTPHPVNTTWDHRPDGVLIQRN